MARPQRLFAACLALAGSIELPAHQSALATKQVVDKHDKHRHTGKFIRTFGLSWEEDDESKPRKAPPAPSLQEGKKKAKAASLHKASKVAPSSHTEDEKASSKTARASASESKHLRSSNATSHAPTTTTTTTPAPPMAGHVYEVDNSSDPHDAWRCIEVRQSSIKGAGRGLFATCDVHADTLIGEYRGMRFMMGERGSTHRLETDWAYIWKVPRCLAPPDKPVVIAKTDKFTAHKCSGANGFVYVDALPMDDEKGNPLRFVNGVRWVGQRKDKMNETIEAFFADDRVWYFTKAEVKRGEEFIVDYGPSYWADATNEAEGGTVPDFGADWGDFVRDS